MTRSVYHKSQLSAHFGQGKHTTFFTFFGNKKNSKKRFVPTTLVQKNLLNKLLFYVFKQIKQHTRVKHS
jgi:hypothetical protein